MAEPEGAYVRVCECGCSKKNQLTLMPGPDSRSDSDQNMYMTPRNPNTLEMRTNQWRTHHRTGPRQVHIKKSCPSPSCPNCRSDPRRHA